MGYFDRLEDWGPYKALWSRFGGRPWTQLSRDWLLAKRHRVGLLCVLFYAAGATKAKRGWAAIILLVLSLFLAHWLF
jgi:hypothetical protein